MSISNKEVEVTQEFGEKRKLTIKRKNMRNKLNTIKYWVSIYNEVTNKTYELPNLTRSELAEILNKVDEIEAFANK